MTRITKIQLRRDSAADWTSTNPTLAEGEIGIETDTGKFKIGDGTTAWNSLAVANPTPVITTVDEVGPIDVTDGELSLQGGWSEYFTAGGSFASFPKITVQSGTTGPASPSVGDVWIKY